MHPRQTVAAALDLARRGATASTISSGLGVPRETVQDWLNGSIPHAANADGCLRCHVEHDFERLPTAYPYLLGLYLGDGCISEHPRSVYKLRIFVDLKYPGIIVDAALAAETVSGHAAGVLTRPMQCVEVYSFWRAWACLFPQHASGVKHERSVVLAGWQQRIADRCPAELLAEAYTTYVSRKADVAVLDEFIGPKR